MSSRRPGGLKPAVRAHPTCPAVLPTGPSQEAWLLAAAAALTHFLRSARPVLSVGGLQSVLPPLPVSVSALTALFSPPPCSVHGPQVPSPACWVDSKAEKAAWTGPSAPNSGGHAAGLISSESGGRYPSTAGSRAHECTCET